MPGEGYPTEKVPRFVSEKREGLVIKEWKTRKTRIVEGNQGLTRWQNTIVVPLTSGPD